MSELKYRVEFSERALKALKKLNKSVAAILFAWIKKNLDGCRDPRMHGKALTGDLGGLWRYRVGDYRLIAEISDGSVTVVIIEIGHRREVYQQ